MSVNENIKYINTKSAKIWLDEGIVNVEYIDGIHGTLDIAKNDLEVIKNLSNNKKVPVIFLMNSVNSVDKAAREFYAGPEAAKVFSAIVLVVNSPVAKTIANFYMKVSKPFFPVKIMNDKKNAIEWLKNYREEFVS